MARPVTAPAGFTIDTGRGYEITGRAEIDAGNGGMLDIVAHPRGRPAVRQRAGRIPSNSSAR